MRSWKDCLVAGWNWCTGQVIQTTTWVCQRLSRTWPGLREADAMWLELVVPGPHHGREPLGSASGFPGSGAVPRWYFRRSCTLALGVGLLTGVSGYLLGPLVASLLCALSGAALTLSAMILLPLWRLLLVSQIEG